jgi:hypothetical protein
VPIGAQLSAAFTGLVEQMLEDQFPDHPRFETEVRPRDLQLVLEQVKLAILTSDGRIQVPSDRRKVMRQIATPLQLGVQHEAPFVLGTHWKDHLDRAVARATQAGAERITVRDMRRWLEEPKPIGLTRDVQSLVVLVYAAQTGRSFQLDGGSEQPTVEKLDDELELVTSELPDESAWHAAVARAASIFDLEAVNPAYNPTAFERLVARLRERGTALLPDAERLVGSLEGRLANLGADPQQAARLCTAVAACELVRGLSDGERPVAVIECLAAAELPASEQVVGASLSTVEAVLATLEDPRWDTLGLAAKRAEQGHVAYRRIVEALAQTLAHDEFAEPLDPAVKRAHSKAIALLEESGSTARPAASSGPGSKPAVAAAAKAGTVHGEAHGIAIAQAREKLDQLDAEPGEVRIDLSWTITTDPGP